MSLKNDVAFAWKNNYERKGIISNFVPIFKRYIGIEKPSEYNTILKAIDNKILENKNNTLFFENGIPFDVDFDLITYINNELLKMDVNNLASQDITLFENAQINNMFLESLQYVVRIAVKKENFINDSMRNNFVAKLILWSLKNIKKIEFSDSVTPKCVFYGKLSAHDIYFLILLYRMTFDVFVINPLKDYTDLWEKIDVDNLSKVESYPAIEQTLKFKDRAKLGAETHSIQTTTSHYESQLEETFFTENSGVYKPFQFKDYKTKSVRISGSIIDLMTVWGEPAKLREGFKIENGTVNIPVFFQVVDGVYDDFVKYKDLINTTCLTPDTIVVTDNGDSLLPPKNSLDINTAYQLMFMQLNDKTIDIEQIKKQPFYPLGIYNISTQNFILNAINEFIKDTSLLAFSMSKEEFLQTILFFLNVSKTIVKLMSNFDFTANIPKIVVFLEGENTLPDPFVLFLAFLHKAGFDILIFNPSAFFSVSKILNPSRFDSVRLDGVKYDAKYQQIVKKKKGFWAKLFS